MAKEPEPACLRLKLTSYPAHTEGISFSRNIGALIDCSLPSSQRLQSHRNTANAAMQQSSAIPKTVFQVFFFAKSIGDMILKCTVFSSGERPPPTQRPFVHAGRC